LPKPWRAFKKGQAGKIMATGSIMGTTALDVSSVY